MELIKHDKHFDIRYFLRNQMIDFKSLINFAIENKFIDQDYARMVFDSYKDATYNRIMETYDFDPEDDYTLKLEELTTRYYKALNDYLRNLESPYLALTEILKNSPKVLICNAYDRFNYFEKIINEKLYQLNQKSSLLKENNFEYNLFIKQINEYQNIFCTSQLLYPTLDNNSVKDVSTLEKLEKVLDEYNIECDILNKFNQREIILLLDKIKHLEDYKGIPSIAMYNYIFNYFFKDSSSIILSDNMRQIVIEGIQNSFFSINDVLDIIENGRIVYNKEEKNYLIENFVPAFNDEIISRKNYMSFVKIK